MFTYIKRFSFFSVALSCVLAGLLACLLVASARADGQANNSDVEALQLSLAVPDASIGDYALDTEALTAFYKARHFRTAWDEPTPEHKERLQAFLHSLQSVIRYHGLNENDFALEPMGKLIDSADKANSLKLELLISDTMLRIGYFLHGYGTDLEALYPGWNFSRDEVNVPQGLADAITEGKVSEFITGLAPTTPAYTGLLKALATYRHYAEKQNWHKIDNGAVLRLNDHDKRVAQIRQRLWSEGFADENMSEKNLSTTYDKALEDQVKAYQQQNGLKADGHIGPQLIEILNIPAAERVRQISANLERLRHMPDEEPERFARVNITDAMLNIYDKGEIVYKGMAIVGRVDRKTPFIQSEIRSVIVNPIWHVPTKIAMKDILPKLRKDPHYLEKHGYVINGSAPHGEDIDWAKMKESQFNFKLRQAPGEHNSLGRLKFDFDNDFSVYMHGTPHMEGFAKQTRTLSSGCVRLMEPTQVAEILLKDNGGEWNQEHIMSEINAGKTRWIKLATTLPVFFVYDTAFLDETGKLNFRKDIYDYDTLLNDYGQGGDFSNSNKVLAKP